MGFSSALGDLLMGAGGEQRIPSPHKSHVNSKIVAMAVTLLANCFSCRFLILMHDFQ